jgi:hypothetical protein
LSVVVVVKFHFFDALALWQKPFHHFPLPPLGTFPSLVFGAKGFIATSTV